MIFPTRRSHLRLSVSNNLTHFSSNFVLNEILQEKLLNNPTFLSRVYIVKWFLCVKTIFFSNDLFCLILSFLSTIFQIVTKCYLSWTLIYEPINSKIFFCIFRILLAKPCYVYFHQYSLSSLFSPYFI